VIRFNGTVLYKDGRTDTFMAGGADLAEWEDYAIRHDIPPNNQERLPGKTMMLVIAHAALGVENGFVPWRRTVLDLDVETVEVPPTLPAPTPEP
jgi:hypothetical protein